MRTAQYAVITCEEATATAWLHSAKKHFMKQCWNKHAASRVVNYELKNKMLENQTVKILILAESVTRHIQGL